MSEADGAGATSAPSAGRLLREARERQGLHIAALAASIKVAPKKLEALEADRFSELPDATFTRALAQTVCRVLKIDALPVMTLLPPPVGHRLEQVGEGLNAPFRDRPGMLVQRDWRTVAASPTFWLTVLILGAAVVIYSLPARLTGIATARWHAASAVAQPARAASAETPGMPPETVLATPTSASASAVPAVASEAAAMSTVPEATPSAAVAQGAVAGAGPAASTPAADAAPAGMLQLRALSESWVEVTDARGHPLVSRVLRPGEAIGIDGAPPLKLRIGNAAGTQVVFRGQPTELAAFTRDNVARLELR